MKTHKISSWVLGIVLCSVIFIVAAVAFKIFDIEMLPSQFFGALIGVVITAIITVLLLKGQTDNAEKLEKNVKIFEHKQEIYHAFIDKIQEIVKDGEITINDTTDELKDLIFQLGYMQMHASEETMDSIMDHLSALIQQMNDFYSLPETEKQKEMANFYARFSYKLFNTIAAIKKDLYGEECHPIEENKMNAILQNCGFFVELGEVNWTEMQTYFWTELQKKLHEKGYVFETKDFSYDVKEFYEHHRNCPRLGFDVPIYTTADGKKVKMRAEVEKNFFYGFRYETKEVELAKDEALTKVVSECGKAFYLNYPWWAGWRYPLNTTIDFWYCRVDENFGEVKNLRHWDRAIAQIAENIDADIKQFRKVAERNNL